MILPDWMLLDINNCTRFMHRYSWVLYLLQYTASGHFLVLL